MNDRLSHIKFVIPFIFLLVIAGYYFSKTQNPEESVEIDYDIQYTVTHPFPIEATRLLTADDTSSYKMDLRLDRNEVNLAVAQTFLDAGLKFSMDTLLQINEFEIPITYYDPENRIGYLWLDPDVYGEGFKQTKLSNLKTHHYYKIQFLKLIDRGVELYLDNEEIFLDDLLGKKETKEDKEKKIATQENWAAAFSELREGKVRFEDVRTLYEEFNLINMKTSIFEDWNFYGRKVDVLNDTHLAMGDDIRKELESFESKSDRIDFIETMLKDFRKKKEVEFLSSKSPKNMLDEWKLSAAEMIKEPEEYFGYIGLINQLRIYKPSKSLLNALDKQILEIILEKNKKTWKKRGKAIFDLFSENKTPGILTKSRYHDLLTDILNSDHYTKWHKRYPEINLLGDTESISLHELKSLEILTHQNYMYIAPISINDVRTIYDMGEAKYKESQAKIRDKINKSKSKIERKSLQEELIEFSNQRAQNYPDLRSRAKEKTIVKLKADVKQFITWAQEQQKILAMK